MTYSEHPIFFHYKQLLGCQGREVLTFGPTNKPVLNCTQSHSKRKREEIQSGCNPTQPNPSAFCIKVRHRDTAYTACTLCTSNQNKQNDNRMTTTECRL
jgi:hypothetical protein